MLLEVGHDRDTVGEAAEDVVVLALLDEAAALVDDPLADDPLADDTLAEDEVVFVTVLPVEYREYELKKFMMTGVASNVCPPLIDGQVWSMLPTL